MAFNSNSASSNPSYATTPSSSTSSDAGVPAPPSNPALTASADTATYNMSPGPGICNSQVGNGPYAPYGQGPDTYMGAQAWGLKH